MRGVGEEQCATTRLHLVVGTIRARHEFAISVVSGEPALQIQLLDGSVVERARDDVDDVVGEAQGLVELLGRLDHLVLHGLARGEVSVAQHELLHLLELTKHRVDDPRW